MESDNCAVCKVLLDDGNTFPQKPTHFVKVCEKHKEYAETYLIDVISENLGYKDVKEFRKCGVCEKNLTNDEVQNSAKKSLNYLCNQHLEKYCGVFQLNRINE